MCFCYQFQLKHIQLQLVGVELQDILPGYTAEVQVQIQFLVQLPQQVVERRSYCFSAAQTGGSGGGGGGGTPATCSGAAGNTPPVSPPQGNHGGQEYRILQVIASGGGGGASAVGVNDYISIEQELVEQVQLQLQFQALLRLCSVGGGGGGGSSTYSGTQVLVELVEVDLEEIQHM
jgi:hypothetical protein